MVRNTNDGTTAAPYVRFDLNEGTITDLPEFSKFPKLIGEARYQEIKNAGFAGVQGGDAAACRRHGLRVTAGARINQLGEIGKLAADWKQAGFDCATLHVAWGFEPDDVVDELVEEVLNASQRQKLPLYIETHRATITNDPWRTIRIAGKFPEIRFNGDFSHWYTGAEMVYGDWGAKLHQLEPVIERVRFIHGRIGNPGSMQVDIGDGKDRPFVDHFRELWTRSFTGFLRTAHPGDYICFTPELLPAGIYYARTFRDATGKFVEEGDRWQQALLYCQIARECFAEAQMRIANGH